MTRIYNTTTKQTIEIRMDDRNGIDYSNGHISNNDVDGCWNTNDAVEADFVMDQEAVDWWVAHCHAYAAAQLAVEEYRAELAGTEDFSFDETLRDYCGCDLEDMPAAMHKAIADHKAQ